MPEHAQQVVRLPGSAGRKPGPIHSLILDESANLYFTDELNHKIVCLSAGEDLRWQIARTEFTPGPLRYPRGLAIGWTFTSGALQRCLAVCDSWNNRIVLFNLEGRPLNQWEAAGEIRFQEVCDVRFISPDNHGEGYWLVLDKGNHRLCGLGLDGRLLFQVGRAFGTDPAWRIPSRDWIEEAAEGIVAFEPYDALYYPTRIIGSSSDAIYLWEPFFGRLTQVLYGNVLPIRMQPACDEWLAADGSGLIGWSAATRRLRRYGSNGGLILEIPVEGTPIGASLSTKEVWLQQRNRIVRQTWKEDDAPTVLPILLRSAEEDLELFDVDQADSARNQYFGCIDSLLAADPGRVDSPIHKLTEARAEWERKVTPWHIAVLKWKLAQAPARLKERIRREWEQLSRPVLAKFREVMPRLDATLMTAWDADLETYKGRLEGALWGIVNGLAEAAGALDRSAKVVDLNHLPPDVPGYPITRPRDSLTLREVARWKLNSGDESLTFPRGLTSSPDGSLFVSFWKSRTILRLDKEGKLLGRFDQPDSAALQLQRPVGIAFDRLSRLWIVDESQNIVLIWDLKNDTSLVVKGEEPDVGGFRGPLGVCEGSEGFMLISDYHNHRILRISLEGECDVFAGGRGNEPAKFQHPGSLYKSKTFQGAGTFLVTDTRNHRIQRLDSSGKFIEQVGGCGLEKGKLVLPLSVAEFDDGALAVSMWHVKRSLVLLSSAGEELGHAAIDYSPADMLVHEGRLLVTDFEGSAIRVYERV